MSAGVQTTVPLALGLLLEGAAPAANAGVSTTFPLALGLLLEAGGSGAATISAAYGTPTGGVTATVGCTTDTSSGTLWALVRIGGSPAADTAIEAGGQSAAVSTTTPSIAYTGLTAATGYSVDIVQKVGGVYSNVLTTTFTTDNTGSGGGEEAHDTVSAVLAGAGAVTAGSAARTRVHAASGALAAAGAVIAGAAARSRVHASSGVLAGAGGAVVGSAEIALPAGTHSAAGTLAGAGAAVAGTATVLRVHAATGVMVGGGAAVAGTSSIRIIHAASGALVGAGAIVAASSEKNRILTNGRRAVYMPPLKRTVTLMRRAEILEDMDVEEDDTIRFDFSNELETGETLVDAIAGDAVVTVEVYSGTDPTPSAFLSGARQVSSPAVRQAVNNPVAGVVYLLRCKAKTSTDRILVRAGYIKGIREGT
ncbi:MAG: hypothetical protein KA179_11005 [Sulfuritalea sp.]|nr:hypothetical protein [Sulfuritalea sp.]